MNGFKTQENYIYENLIYFGNNCFRYCFKNFVNIVYRINIIKSNTYTSGKYCRTLFNM